MTVPILPLYLVGIFFFVVGLEDTEDFKKIIYFALAAFINYMGYILSYSDTDYTYSVYLPLIFMIVSVLFVIYTAWNMIPTGKSWKEQTDED